MVQYQPHQEHHIPLNPRPWKSSRLPGENQQQYADRINRAYFSWHMHECEAFWARIGHAIDFRGKRILDLGCGHGALCVNMMQKGADEVTGVDLSSSLIQFAQTHAFKFREPSWGRLEFVCQDIRHLDRAGYYDYVISKDTFEHVEDVCALMRDIARLLKPGGKLITGFSPLYYSPYGDHGRWHVPVPWLHTIVPEFLLRKWLAMRKGLKVASVVDLGLNKLTLPQFRKCIRSEEWMTNSLQVNRKEDSRLIRIFNALRRIPFLEKYFTVSIYAVLQKK